MSLTVRNSIGHWAAVVSIAVLFLAAAALTLSGSAEAQSHTATRSFSAASVTPGGLLEVSVVAERHGAIGQVEETLPEGFVYLGSDLPDAAVSVQGQSVAFTLFQSSSFTYVVSAPAQEGVYAFTGIVKDQLRQEQPVTGAGSVRVGLPPTLAPTAAPTRAPTAAPTRAPAARPTMAPTPAPTAAPATSTTAARTAAVTPVTTETARPAQTAKPTPPPPAPSDSMDDLPTWAIGAIVGGVGALFVAGLAVVFVLARRRREERWRYSRW